MQDLKPGIPRPFYKVWVFHFLIHKYPGSGNSKCLPIAARFRLDAMSFS